MMLNTKPKYLPYAYVGNVINVLRQIKKSTYMDAISKETILDANVSEGNLYSTIGALKFLGVIELEEKLSSSEQGELKLTPIGQQLVNSSEDEYLDLLSSMVKKSYSAIFNQGKDIDVSDEVMFSYFTIYGPQTQVRKKVSLFKGLCQEAGILEGKPLISNRIKNRKLSPKDTGNAFWYTKLQTLINYLPNENNLSWSLSEKNKWIESLSSFLDLVINIKDE